MIKKVLGGVFLLLCISILGASLNTWHIEKIDRLVRYEIQKFSSESLPLNILPGQIQFKLLPLTLIVNDIKIEPKKEISNNLRPLEIKMVRIRPSLLHMLIGKLHLAKIEVVGSTIDASIAIKDTKEDTKIYLRKILEKIPVTQLHASQINLNFNISESGNNYGLATQGVDAIVTNDVNNLLVNVKVASLNGTFNGTSVAESAFFQTHFFLTEKNLVLSDFKFKENTDYIVASGSTQHNLVKKVISSGSLNLRSQLGVKKGRSLFSLFNAGGGPNPLEKIQGELRSDLRLNFTGVNKYSIKTQTTVAGFTYEKFHVGDIDLKGHYASDTKIIVGDEITVSNSGLKGVVKKFSMNIGELTFKGAEVTIQKFGLFPFLEHALKLKVPADVKAQGNLKCDGQIRNFRIDCAGTMNASEARVNPGKIPIINDVPNATAEGTVTVNDKEVTYSAQISMGSSRGSSQGSINYSKGFLINYESPNLNLSEIKKVSVLELEGVSKVSGFTQGNSDAATFEITMDGKNLSLNKYKLGDVTGIIKYKTGKVYAEKIQGALVSSRYLGNLVVDLENELLSGKLQFPFVDIAVLKDSIKENLLIPVDLTGSGSAIVTIDGPLDPNHLSFKAKARLYNCKIDQQHVDTAEVDLTSVLGRVAFNSAYFEEKNSNMLFKGEILLDKKEYNLTFSSQRIQLDDLVYSKNYAAPTKGIFQLEGKIRNSFQNPSLDFHFTSENFSIAGQKLSPIIGDVKFTEARNSGEVLGPKGLKLSYRDIKSNPDIQIEGTTQEMNLAPLLTSLMELDTVDDYSILASSNFNLKINRANREKVNGYVFLPSLQFSLQKLDLKNEKEISIFFTNGKANFAPVAMNGKGGKLQFKSTSNSTSPFDVQISGLFSLSFLQIFAPFLETLEGQTSVNFRLRSESGKLRFLGSAFIEDGFIKLPEIQHAIEDLKVDMLFNQDQININSLKGKFASGQLIGDGKIVLKGKKDIPTQIKVHLENVDLNIPDGVNTQGNADIQITGNWLPFLLTGSYVVTEGNITKEFSGAEGRSTNPHQIFLPMALRAESISPVRLDLAITPLTPIKLKNTLVDGKVEGKLKVTGYPQTPILTGTFSFTKNTQLNFRDVIFKVRDSSVGLTGTNPPNPTLYILAEARHMGYDIEMLIQGTAEKPKFKLQSQPSLTEPEIISLLTLGYTSSESTTQANAAGGTAKSTLGGQSSLEIGTGLFSANPLGKEFKNRFGFDVQVSSRFDSATSVAVPKISATKQFSEKVSGVYSVQTGKDSRREGKVRYELNRGFAATFSVQSQTQEETNVQRGDVVSDILGIDLEFRKDFK